ncbi:MAG: methyltransferase domain-containing protein [Gammaproteobacteria bacterium]|nr:methyltransferase domain-containing protein [Gammaproteobacteria bacterium]
MDTSSSVTQEILDSSQYSVSSIQHYEVVYGEDFVSPGGKQMAVELIQKMDLKPEAHVLDVGCGLGGSAFVMAREFNLVVDGIDLSKNMLELANKKLNNYGLADRVKLEHGDCLELDRTEYYDAVYSRDVFLHIENKAQLFSVLKRSLRPDGRLLFTDYCCGPKPWCDDFNKYVKDRGYCLHTLPEYADLVSEARFEKVEHVDMTPRFIQILKSDLEKIADLPLEETVRCNLEKSWRGKLARVESGDHRWGMLSAVN